MLPNVSFDRKDYAPRPYSIADHAAISQHVRVIAEATDDQGRVVLDGWRRRLVGKLEVHQCDHVERSIFDVANPYGVWAIEICLLCGEQVKKVCHHIRSDWNEAGNVLICGNCGIDGT